jgi:Zn-dependent protease
LGFDFADMLQRGLLFLPPLLLSLTFHEFAHAWSAHRLGDDTAERAGRLTLNPLPHIDPIGTLLLPLLGAPIGWAKPVPVNSARFRRDVSASRGIVFTSAAGPLSNLLLATICAVIFGLLVRFAPGLVAPGEGVRSLLTMMIRLNVMLAVFNLLPIPPLDGGHVAEALVPYRMRGAWDSFARFAPLVLLALIFLPMSPLRTILGVPSDAILSVLQRVVNAIV